MHLPVEHLPTLWAACGCLSAQYQSEARRIAYISTATPEMASVQLTAFAPCFLLRGGVWFEPRFTKVSWNLTRAGDCRVIASDALLCRVCCVAEHTAFGLAAFGLSRTLGTKTRAARHPFGAAS